VYRLSGFAPIGRLNINVVENFWRSFTFSSSTTAVPVEASVCSPRNQGKTRAMLIPAGTEAVNVQGGTCERGK
jgi:hypothetical protein